MAYYRESRLRERVDKPTLDIFDLWHSLCIKKLGKKLEIFARDSKEHPTYGKIKGGSPSFAYPVYKDDKIVGWCLWIAGFPNVDNILITHELSHGILRLMGYKAARQNDDINSLTEIFLHSLCDHPVIHNLQNTYGQNPQSMIDDRAKKNATYVTKSYIRLLNDNLLDSLLLADDVYNSSKNVRNFILRRCKRFHPNIHDMINQIISIVNRYNLLIAENNLICRFEIIDVLNIKGDWIIYDDVVALKQKI